MNQQHPDQEELNQPEIESNLSAVAMSPKKNLFILMIVAILSISLVYFLFFKESDEDKKKRLQAQRPSELSTTVETIKPASAESIIPVPVMPKLPEPPALVAPAPPPVTPPAVPVVVATPTMQVPPAIPEVINNNDRQSNLSRKKSTIMLAVSNSSNSDKNLTSKTELVNDSDYYFKPNKTVAHQSKVTSIGNNAFVIAQGKIIDAVLETAINTDLAGSIRAMINRDVYAESGKNILIPKGARLIGNYLSGIKRGQKRVSIQWNRIIRPDGIDITIEKSEAVDKLGRTGVEGIVDNKYLEIFGNSILMSIINVGIAIGAEKITNYQAPKDPVTTTTNAALGTTTTTSTTQKPSDQAIQQAIQSLGETGKKVTQDALSVNPTIIIDQGTLIKVFVNQDIIFPANLANDIKLLQ